MIFQVAIDEVIANRLLLKEVIYANICESSLSPQKTKILHVRAKGAHNIFHVRPYGDTHHRSEYS